MAFRDDREALLARVAALESELGEQRGGAAERQALLVELDVLRGQVRTASGALEQDRAALREVGAALDRLRERVAPAPAPARVAAVEGLAPRRNDNTMKMIAIGGVAVALVSAAVVLLGARSKAAPRPPEVAVSRQVGPTEVVAEPPVLALTAAPEPVVEPAPERLHCDVISRPMGAELLRDGVKLGKTPLRISVQAGDDTRGYTLRLAGFRDVALQLTPAPGCRIDVVMHQQGPK